MKNGRQRQTKKRGHRYGSVRRGLAARRIAAIPRRANWQFASSIPPRKQGIGLREGGDVLGGEERWQALLPEVVGALDLALGLWGGRVTQGDVVKAQSPAQLGEGVGGAGEEERVVVT